MPVALCNVKGCPCPIASCFHFSHSLSQVVSLIYAIAGYLVYFVANSSICLEVILFVVIRESRMQVEVSKHTEGRKEGVMRPNGLPESLIQYDGQCLWSWVGHLFQVFLFVTDDHHAKKYQEIRLSRPLWVNSICQVLLYIYNSNFFRIRLL